jgi:hypothetical protein
MLHLAEGTKVRFVGALPSPFYFQSSTQIPQNPEAPTGDCSLVKRDSARAAF